VVAQLGVLLGAPMMIGPANIGFVSSPYMPSPFFTRRFRSPDDLGALQYALRRSLRFARGRHGQRLRRHGGLTGGLGFSLLVGALADSVGYGPLFGLPSVFDLVGAAALIVLIGGERQVERYAAA
jgi:ACS family hexuronate transporter-like MFS transporter